MTPTFQSWRAGLRLYSALVLLSFVICHLSAHSLLLVSFEDAEATRNVLMYPWRTPMGTVVLGSAFVVHFGNALWSIYIRRSLRLTRWEWAQLSLGLTIPALLMFHVIATRIAEELLDVTTYYTTVFIVQWLIFPWLGAIQMLAVIIVWTHASIGIHYWLRTKRWYPTWRPLLFGFALLLPALALAGYVTGGNQVLRQAKSDPNFVAESLGDSNVTPEATAAINRMAAIGWSVWLALVLSPFAGRAVREWRYRRSEPPMLSHAGGRSVPILPGATVLETLRAHGIAHASVCGGRARCTTCRVLVTKGLERLAEPAGLEAKALSRIGATPGMRLACQIRPMADLAVMPLLAADADAADGAVRGGLEGSERLVTVVFVDLRGSTTLGEARLPYDVLFILNQFFYEMTNALVATRGHYSQFTGDGLMALYGLYADPASGAADAVRGAREMLSRLHALNFQLRSDLREPLRIGIGIHHSEAIVGAMGPPHSQIITAIGDTVNTCARLESLTKEYDCAVVISRQAAEAAGLRLVGHDLHQAPVKGRKEPVEFYALQSLDSLPI
ncbi:MAG TPA: adenylate/guanylate cyclase domain-containing protein [Xanthobacteraceae bacterium]|nr:adenylate/guanylate cyclase domain-containing protein [Xanthobacteraceae bacterium]